MYEINHYGDKSDMYKKESEYINKEVKKSPIFKSKFIDSRIEKLNKDIIHLLKTENNSNIVDNNQNILIDKNNNDKNKNDKNNINKNINNKIQNDKSNIDNNINDKNMSLPIIKLNNLINNSSSLLYTSPKSNKENDNIKKISTSLNSHNNKYKQKILYKEKLSTNKNTTNITINNYNLNKTSNFNLNKNIIKRNISNLINDNKTIEENKINMYKKMKMMNIFYKKKIINLNKELKIKNHSLGKIKSFLMNSKTNTTHINYSYQKNKLKRIINKNSNDENKKNTNKNYSINIPLSKLDEYYLQLKLKYSQNRNEKKFRGKKSTKNEKILNNYIKKEIFNYNELYLKNQRMNTLQKIKDKNITIKEFKNDINLHTKDGQSMFKDDKLFNSLTKKNNNNKKIYIKDNYDDYFKNNIKINKNNFSKKEEIITDKLLNNNTIKNDCYNNNKKLDKLFKNEIELYSI